MPIYDFYDTANPGYSSVFSVGESYTHTADGIEFTLSFEDGQGDLFFAVGSDGTDAGGPPHLYLANSTDNTLVPDVVRLTLKSTANPNNHILSGTALNPVTLMANDYAAAGVVRVSFTDSRDNSGTVVRTIVNNTGQLTAVGEFTGIVFTLSFPASTAQTFTQLTANALVCFLEGTGIATAAGRVAVQDLRPGDILQRADGGRTTVRWVGQSRVDLSSERSIDVFPIRIAAGALGRGLPERDLFVSSKHAVAVDGVLVNAEVLVNGRTITRETSVEADSLTYYHVETDAHELILAEGLAAESYLEHVVPDSFDNETDREIRMVPEMALPRVTSRRLLPAKLRDRLRAGNRTAEAA